MCNQLLTCHPFKILELLGIVSILGIVRTICETSDKVLKIFLQLLRTGMRLYTLSFFYCLYHINF
jgi:hypothetical protein